MTQQNTFRSRRFVPYLLSIVLTLSKALALVPETSAQPRHSSNKKHTFKAKAKSSNRQRQRLATSHKLFPTPVPYAEEEPGEQFAENRGEVEGRQQWFVYERSYPFDGLPSEGRREAWELLNRGMPPVIVMALAAPSSGIIQAATYGRSVYEINLRTTLTVSQAPSPTHKEKQQ